jgi:hypothetical protein
MSRGVVEVGTGVVFAVEVGAGEVEQAVNVGLSGAVGQRQHAV